MKTLMRTTLRVCALAAFALASPFAWAQLPGTGLSGTLHDFSNVTGAGEDSGPCTYCHTPHVAQQQNLLWNRTLSAGGYNWAAGEVTTGGTTYASIPSTYNGTSIKCLSCHDGVVAVGNVSWWNAQGPVAFGTGPVGAPYIVGGGGVMTGNHPVAMPYPGGANVVTYNGVVANKPPIVDEWVADPGALGIRLYQDDGLGNISAQTGPANASSGIECASCHDPHNGSTVQGPFFLRGLLGTNGADYICTKCHDKL